MFGTLADFDALLAAVHARGMKLVMDLVVNHTSDEHPWFVESRSRPTTPSGTGTGGARPARACTAGDPGAEPTNWGSFFSGLGLAATTRTPASTTCTCSPASSPTSTGRTRRSAQAVYAMMRWWLDRGVDGFRMDVINMISKDTALPDGHLHVGQWGDGSPYFINGPRHARVPAGDAPRGVRRPQAPAAHGRRDARRAPSTRPGCSPTRRRAEVDMVFQFEHVSLRPGRVASGTSTRCAWST